jgi:hypothetical protein
MKTIQGPRTTPIYRLTCSNAKCAAVMECSEDELRYESDQRDGDAYVLRCPHCKSETWIDVRAIGKFQVKT